MPPPSTPNPRTSNVLPTNQEQSEDIPSSSSSPNFSRYEEANTLDSMQRFRNASNTTNNTSSFSRLNSINLVSDYMYRNLHAEYNDHAINEPDAHFRSRILRHFSDMHRLQNHFNELINAREQRNTLDHELAINTIPVQLRNLSRELTRNDNREAYYIETTDEDDQSFQEDDDPNVIYYSDNHDESDVIEVDDDESALSDDASASLRQDVQNNERLIVTSARNNSALYPYRSSLLGTTSALPLRRQNAIRIRQPPNKQGEEHAKSTNKDGNLITEVLNEEANALRTDISKFYQALQASGCFQGESPLFEKNYHDHGANFRELYLTGPNGGSAMITEYRLSNLDQRMDAYLQSRRNRSLWQKTTLPIPPPPALDKKRSRGIAKRTSKKQKLIHNTDDEVAKYVDDAPFNFPKTRYTYSKTEKEAIMNGLPSSLLESGSSYSVGISADPLYRCDVNFTDVNKIIHGVFSFTPEEKSPLLSVLLKLHNFTKFFCGFNDYAQNLPRSKILVRKLNVLDRISIDNKVHFNNFKTRGVNIPFNGHLVDFRNRDLRFLNYDSNESFSSRFKTNRVRLQLLEWMKLHPFIQFKENYFLSFLREVNDSMGYICEAKMKKSTKSQALNTVKDFISNLHELTKDFSFIKDTNSPLLEEQRKQKQCSRRYKDLFVDEWERYLTGKLCQNITTKESNTLINVQLNFILFVLEVDLSKFLDNFMDFIFQHCDNNDYINNYRKVYRNILSDEAKESDNYRAILICSIDRKTGAIEIHNTLPYLHYKDRSIKNTNFILSSDHNLSTYSSRNTYVYDDFEIFEGENVPLNSGTFNTSINLDGSTEAVVDSNLTGTVKLGTPVCDMV
ncbi:hypothetical protein L150_05395 [Candida albicans Ca529L]|nr:hypothetical protein L150_05395 [Candida albicans Ca529L]